MERVEDVESRDVKGRDVEGRDVREQRCGGSGDVKSPGGIVLAASRACLQPWSTQLYCDLQASDCRSQWTCCVKVMFGG